MNKKNIFDCIGIIILLLLAICVVSCDMRPKEPRETIGYFNIPTYTTVYEIVYPDSTYRYTCTSHIKLELDSYKGTNYLRPNYGYNWRRYKPEWWNDNWKEPEISTTAPIRIVSITVKHKKVKYKRDSFNHIKYTESNGVVTM